MVNYKIDFKCQRCPTCGESGGISDEIPEENPDVELKMAFLKLDEPEPLEEPEQDEEGHDFYDDDDECMKTNVQ